jgi:hypothetical protein
LTIRIAVWRDTRGKNNSQEINLKSQPYFHWTIYIPNAENLLLHVPALHACHRQGVFTAV